MTRKRGVVKWFHRLRGFGFIEPEDGGDDVFVHYEAIEGEGYRKLKTGDAVVFEEVDRGKGRQADKVRAG